jgi:hypothetical protein
MFWANLMNAELEEILASLAEPEKTDEQLAKEFFYASLIENLTLGGIEFDRVSRLTISRQGKEATFDIVLQNTTAIVVVQVLDKFQPNCLDQVETQMQRYREFFPEHKNHKLYGGVAGFSVPDEVVQQAQARKMFVMKPQSDAATAKREARALSDAATQAKHKECFAELDAQYETQQQLVKKSTFNPQKP